MALKTVYIELVAETKRLLAGFKRVDKKTSAMTRSFKRMGAALIGVFGARALFRGFNQTLKSTEALIKTAKGVGFATNEYRRLTFTLSQVGVEASAARIALGDFQKRLAKPQFHKFFRQAGLDPKELQKLSPAAAFESAFDHLATLVDDPRAAGFFGTIFEEQAGKNMLKAARQMGLLLESRKDYDRLVGRGLTREDARSIEETGRQTRLLGLQWGTLKQRVVIETLPALSNLLDKIEESDAFSTLAKDISTVADAMADLIGRAAAFRKALSGDRSEFSLTPAFGVTALRTPEGHETPQEAAERFAAIHRMRQGTGELISKIPPPNTGGVSQYTLMKALGAHEKDIPDVSIIQNFNGVTSENVAGKTKRAAAAGAREAQAPE